MLDNVDEKNLAAALPVTAASETPICDGAECGQSGAPIRADVARQLERDRARLIALVKEYADEYGHTSFSKTLRELGRP